MQMMGFALKRSLKNGFCIKKMGYNRALFKIGSIGKIAMVHNITHKLSKHCPILRNLICYFCSPSIYMQYDSAALRNKNVNTGVFSTQIRSNQFLCFVITVKMPVYGIYQTSLEYTLRFRAYSLCDKAKRLYYTIEYCIITAPYAHLTL